MPEWTQDRIEALESELTRLRELNRKLTDDFNTILLEEAKQRWRARKLEEEIGELTNEVGRLREIGGEN
jgi:HAMP domain-containing protein